MCKDGTVIEKVSSSIHVQPGSAGSWTHPWPMGTKSDRNFPPIIPQAANFDIYFIKLFKNSQWDWSLVIHTSGQLDHLSLYFIPCRCLSPALYSYSLVSYYQINHLP